MKTNCYLLILFLVFSACTVPFGINHWAAEEDIRLLPAQAYGKWNLTTKSGGVEKDVIFNVKLPVSDETGTKNPNTFSIDWIFDKPKEHKTDTIALDGLYFEIDGVMFVEIIRVMNDLQLEETLSSSDLFYSEKKFIFIIRSISKQKIEFNEVDAADLKTVNASLSLPIFFSDKPKDEQYFLGSTTDLKKLLQEYVKQGLYNDDKTSFLIRPQDSK